MVDSLQFTDMNARAALRKTLRTARKAIATDAQRRAAKAVVSQLLLLFPRDQHCNVAVYLQNDGEVDLQAFVSHCWRELPNITFCLPVLHPVCKGHLLFLRYSAQTKMIENKYRIKEPQLACYDVIPAKNINFILMPLVGFDAAGNRLGMGGGYYDRTLAFTKLANTKPTLIGVAHDIQEVSALPIAPWDIPLDAIVTPTRMLHF